jgi:hypothetical protein
LREAAGQEGVDPMNRFAGIALVGSGPPAKKVCSRADSDRQEKRTEEKVYALMDE